SHSLKGGAGIAQLSNLAELAHKLEDILEVLQKGEITNSREGWLLMEWGTNEVAMLLNQARTMDDVVADPKLFQALNKFIGPKSTVKSSKQMNLVGQDNSLVRKVLENDLAACCTRIKELSDETPLEEIQEAIITFYNECLLLGETLDLPWIIQIIEPLEIILEQIQPLEALQIAQELAIELIKQSNDYLTAQNSEPSNSISLAEKTTFEVEQWDNNETDWDDELDSVIDLNDLDQSLDDHSDSDQSFIADTEKENHTSFQEVNQELDSLSQLRIPLEKLEGMTNKIEELVVTKEKLRVQQQQLNQVTRQLRSITRQFSPIIEQVQNSYDQLAIAPLSTTYSRNGDFDVLELDGFTELHSQLQTFQELISKIQENYADLNLINQDFGDNLETVEINLDELYTNINQSRLVPFRIIAERFFPQIQYLNRRYGKSVELSVKEVDILIDQVILEQLQTPLIHLLNNAFDHGIEETTERLAKNKLATATITIEAKVENNYLVLSLTDDGQGIDLYKVYQRAKEKGISDCHLPFKKLSPSTILNCIFQPNFSTTKTVNQISGRGVGLDIVRSKIQKLRGTIEVKTQAGKGTTFTIKIPLNLSLIPLFLLNWQNHLLAIPTESILDNIPVAEIVWVDHEAKIVKWRGKTIQVIAISELLSYPQKSTDSVSPQMGIVLENGSTPFMVMVDALISEQKLIVKPFDDTVNTPNYLAGATILGGGEIVPVIFPNLFTLSSSLNNEPEPEISSTIATTDKMTILVAEDSVATRRLFERILTKMGFSVIVCRDGFDALEQLARNRGKVNLIISDIEMPRLNGFELLKTIRCDDHWVDVPVVMATSRTGQPHRQQAMQLGANAYLGKPILPNVLLETIQPLLKMID
ncbi:MAG TPA: hybrid sensor histidine kinase/response regulator, partial [Cyanothece sp. UBA12306]|nr:hybrid sensor histidine kinase/response regulator [Cyanothece sp. UBA12306]